MNHLLRTERGLEADLHLDQLGNRAAGLCLCCDRLKRVPVNARYSGGDGEMDRGDGKPSPSFSMTTTEWLSTHCGTKCAIPSILTNDMVKHAACAAPTSSSGLVPGVSP
jgi:hypothetical protein